jgi:hypothetical protein
MSKLLAIAFAILFLANAHAADRKVMRVISDSEPPLIQVDVLLRAGLQRIDKPAPRPLWKFVPGEIVRTTARPADRVVDVYTGTPQTPSLLCRIVVRYFPSPAGWVPQFQLIEEPALALINGRWQPVPIGRGTALLVQHGSALPNADGFFPRLELGMTTGAFPVVAWEVR